MSDSRGFSDQQKLLNDHNLRVLVEQNAELRHCDTLSLAGVAAAFAVISFILRDVRFFGILPDNVPQTVHNYAVMVDKEIIAKTFFSVWLVIISAIALFLHLNVIANRAISRIDAVYKHFSHLIDLKHLEPIQEIIYRNQTFYVSSRGKLPNSLFAMTLIVLLFLLGLVVTIGLLAIYRG